MNTLPTAKLLRFWLPNACVPKARPMVTRNGTYLPERYQVWRETAECEILATLSSSERASLPITKAEVRITLQGKHRGDIDNLAGACLDTLVSSGVLLDDRLTCVPRLVIEHKLSGSSGCLVELIPM